MNTINLLEAVGQVNESYISALLEEKPGRSHSLTRRRLWIAAAACLCLIIGGLIYMHVKGEQPTLGFAITAYAKSQDGEGIDEVILKLSEPVPVDAFYNDNGQPIFVFSFPADSTNPRIGLPFLLDYRVNSYPYLSFDDLRNITGIEEQPEYLFFYYLPDIKEQPPYNFFMNIAGADENSYATYAYLKITKAEKKYSVELVEIKKVKVIKTYPEDYEITYDENGNIIGVFWKNASAKPEQFPGGWDMDTHY